MGAQLDRACTPSAGGGQPVSVGASGVPRSGPLAPVLDDLNELRIPRRNHRDLCWCGDFPSAHSVPRESIRNSSQFTSTRSSISFQGLTDQSPRVYPWGADLPLGLCLWSMCSFMFQSGTGATSRQRGTAPWAGQPESTVLPARWGPQLLSPHSLLSHRLQL